MARKKARKRSIPPIQELPTPWYKKVWVAVSIMGVVFFTLIVNAPSLLANLENLPGDTTRTKNKFLSWYYDDNNWTGLWSSFPEGYVNMVEMELSDVDLTIDIVSANGEINGIIATKKICAAAPFSPFLLIDGDIKGDVANIKVYDFVGGRREDFVTAKLKREGVVMTVLPMNGIVDWLPDGARIGLHPDSSEGIKDSIFSNFCKEERAAALKLLRKNNPENDTKTRRPISEY